jgi:hypothetical protein
MTKSLPTVREWENNVMILSLIRTHKMNSMPKVKQDVRIVNNGLSRKDLNSRWPPTSRCFLYRELLFDIHGAIAKKSHLGVSTFSSFVIISLIPFALRSSPRLIWYPSSIKE